MRVLLEESGGVLAADGRPLEEWSLNPVEQRLLMVLRSNPHQHFFKLPFSRIVRVQGGSRINSFISHPSTFYPGTPFDTFVSVREFTKNGRVMLPRLYLYPTSACNSNCPICQFSFRHRTPYAIPFHLITKALDEFAACSQTLHAPTLIISGDGEPTVYRELPKLIEAAVERRMRVFLTTNLILPTKHHADILESISEYVSMLTVSIKGLSQTAYDKYQGLTSGTTFNKVLDNLQSVLSRMEMNGRRPEVLVGVASLVLPENSSQYRRMLRWFADRGLDYVYLNLVEPSPERWGISFTAEEQSLTMDSFSGLDEFTSGGMLIRYSRNPFRPPQENVYYDASLRDQPDICGSALWNPIIIPTRDDGRLLACRNSENFTKPEFTYFNSLRGCSFNAALNGSARNAVMAASSKCHSCRLERHVRTFDRLLAWERDSGGEGSFVLEFDFDRLQQNGPGGAIAFEDTFASDVHKTTARFTGTM